MVQLDGVAEPVLRWAVRAGNLPLALKRFEAYLKRTFAVVRSNPGKHSR